MKKLLILLMVSIITGFCIVSHQYTHKQHTAIETKRNESPQKAYIISGDAIDAHTWQEISHDPTAQILKTDSLHWLEQEQQALWHELTQLGVPPELFKQHETQYRAEYNIYNEHPDQTNKLNPNTIALIKNVLKEFNINTDAIVFCPLDVRSPIATTDCAILINESMFNQMTHKAKIFTIGHEAQHIRFQDDSTFCIIEQLLDQQQCASQLKQKIMERFSRFLEARADYYAAIKNPEYAQGLIEFMGYMYKKGGENGITSHPLKKTRIALGKKILQQHTHV